jgi:uncharacterized protein (DUF1778 family)
MYREDNRLTVPGSAGGVRQLFGGLILGFLAHLLLLRSWLAIDDAAAVLGKMRTEFMVESARRQAVDVLIDQRLFTLDTDHYDAFMQALDNPPAPGPKLKALLRRVHAPVCRPLFP